MIESNAYMKPGARKSARGAEPPGGDRALPGCGHTLQVCYSGRDAASPEFRCLASPSSDRSAACVSFAGKASSRDWRPGAPGDRDQDIDAAIEAARRAERAAIVRSVTRSGLSRTRALRCQLAARRYEHVDPAMRLDRRRTRSALERGARTGA